MTTIPAPGAPDLSGKIALITGSTTGIGLEMARSLAYCGATIILNGLGEPDQIEADRAALAAETGAKVAFEGANLLHASEITAMVDRIEADHGTVDILINNAGTQFTAATEDFPPERFDMILALNQAAVFHGCRRVIPGMRQKGWGRIINTASVHGLVGSVQKVAYVGTKHAVVGMTKVMALELATAGVTVNAICPGWTRTDLIEPQIQARAERFGGDLDAGARDLVGEKQPSQTFVQPWHLGHLVSFLCSEAASQLTGVSIPVDGGWTAQ